MAGQRFKKGFKGRKCKSNISCRYHNKSAHVATHTGDFYCEAVAGNISYLLMLILPLSPPFNLLWKLWMKTETQQLAGDEDLTRILREFKFHCCPCGGAWRIRAHPPSSSGLWSLVIPELIAHPWPPGKGRIIFHLFVIPPTCLQVHLKAIPCVVVVVVVVLKLWSSV